MTFTLSLFFIYLYTYVFLVILVVVFAVTWFRLVPRSFVFFYLTFLAKYTNIKNLFYFLVFSLGGLFFMVLVLIKFKILILIVDENPFLFFFACVSGFPLTMLLNNKMFYRDGGSNPTIIQVWVEDARFNYGDSLIPYLTFFIVAPLGSIFAISFIFIDLLILLYL